MSAPVVAIIGRPNVGKSTFFNRLLGEPPAVVPGGPIRMSAENGFGIGDLLAELVTGWPPEEERQARPSAGVAIIGRPNVGKSSIVNALLGEERMLVEPQAGTTMDAIDSLWKTPSGDFVLDDTAGIRRHSHFGDEAEFFATLRAMHAPDRADLAVL